MTLSHGGRSSRYEVSAIIFEGGFYADGVKSSTLAVGQTTKPMKPNWPNHNSAAKDDGDMEGHIIHYNVVNGKRQIVAVSRETMEKLTPSPDDSISTKAGMLDYASKALGKQFGFNKDVPIKVKKKATDKGGAAYVGINSESFM